tara:strand:+ start:6087 stop:6827 length:741 start_codon:yes stop_codon:yes gene_type:complete
MNVTRILSSLRGILEYQFLAHIVGIWVLLKGGIVNSRGVSLNVKNNRITNSARYHLFCNKFEENEFDLLDAHFLSNLDVVELGGGIGFISCHIGKKLQPKNKHIVIEPNPFLLDTIESNRILNNCHFDIINYAYSSTPGLVEFDVSGPFESSHIDPSSTNTVQIESINITQIINQYDLNQFSLIVDIEGNEFDLLQQELNILHLHCPLVMIEFHPRFGPLPPAVSKLKNLGYSSFKNDNVYLFIRN